MTKKLLTVLTLLLAILLLAACGGDDESEDQPTDTPAPTATTAPDTPVPTTPPLANTPVQLSEEALFEEAASQARVDLAAHLDVSITRIEIMDPDTVLFMDEPALCEDVPGDLEAFYVYLRHERDVYPYQFYTPGDVEDVIVERCADVLLDEDVLYVPTPNARAAVIEYVQADLRAQGINPDTGQYTVREMDWTDTALGCRLPEDQDPTPALINGYLVIYELDGASYEYHADASGERIEYCAPPMGYASIAAFKFSLRKEENRDFEEPGEVARYEGLDAEGEIVLLTPDEYRVGLFQFDTPQAARIAAGQIDDFDVSHIFVSGYVLIVQEENSPEVYDILLTYAEEVRAPIIERQDD